LYKYMLINEFLLLLITNILSLSSFTLINPQRYTHTHTLLLPSDLFLFSCRVHTHIHTYTLDPSTD